MSAKAVQAKHNGSTSGKVGVMLSDASAQGSSSSPAGFAALLIDASLGEPLTQQYLLELAAKRSSCFAFAALLGGSKASVIS